MPKSTERTRVYETVYHNLRSQIFSGRYHPGDLLPSESQLCATFHASRETIRKGLKALEQEELIFSRPKVGYFVSTPNHSNVTLTFSDELTNCSSDYNDIHGIVPDEALQKKLQIDGSQKVIELSQITRNTAGTPVAYDIKYVPYERAYPTVESEIRFAAFPDITLSKFSSFDYYIDIAITAVGAPEEIAQVMECPVATPLLRLERTFIRQDGKHIGYSIQYRLGDFGTLRGSSGNHYK